MRNPRAVRLKMLTPSMSLVCCVVCSQITLGILISNLIGYFCVQHVPSGWRYVQFAVIVPAVLQCMLAWLVPESPRW